MSEKLFYVDPYMKEFQATVISCEQQGDKWLVVLDKTAFYPEGGGQPSDQGYMTPHGNICREAKVLDVHEKNGVIVHTVDAEFAEGEVVDCRLDWDLRFDHMQQHSGEHIVSGMICSRFDCDNIGFHMGSEVVQIDYNADMTWDDVLEIEAQANRYIWENHTIQISWPSAEELKQIDYRSKKELSGDVRITCWPDADTCACCGTHVTNSGEVGLVKMLSVQKIKEGVRIEMLSGKRAFDYLSDTWEQNLIISRELSAKPKETFAAVEKLKAEFFAVKGRLAKAEEKIFETIAEQYDGAEYPVVFISETESDNVRKLCDMISENTCGKCFVFSGDGENYKYAVIDKDNDIRDYIKEMNTALNGRGGGKNGFAQGSVQASREDIVKFVSAERKMD